MSADPFLHSTKYSIKDSVSYSENSIVSKVISKNENVNLTFFAFDKGQALTKHTSPFNAMIQVLEGGAKIEIGDNHHNLKEGEFIIMPANVPHAVEATDRFKMLLTMIKGQ